SWGPLARADVEESRIDEIPVRAQVELEVEFERAAVPSRITCAAGAAEDGAGLAEALERIEPRGMLVGDQGTKGVGVLSSRGEKNWGEGRSPARRSRRETGIMSGRDK